MPPHKRLRMVWLLALLCLPAIRLQSQDAKAVSYAGPREKLHIYLLIGQSNMSGRARFTEEQAEEIERAYLLNREDQWEPAKIPLNRYSSVRKRAFQGMNPGYTFAIDMLENTKDINLGLVVNARGGTRIQQWQKGTRLYEEAIRRTREARKFGTLKGILWHQGEANSRDVATYLEMLVELIKSFREDLDEPNLPFVAGQLARGRDGKPGGISREIAKLPEALAYTGFASSEGVTNNAETRHIDNRSMRLLGKRYAEEISSIADVAASVEQGRVKYPCSR